MTAMHRTSATTHEVGTLADGVDPDFLMGSILPRAHMYERPSAVALRDCLASFARYTGLPPDGEAILQQHVCAVVDDLREDGVSAEEVVKAVKQIAEDGGFRGSSAMSVYTTPLTWQDTLLLRMVAWSVQQYCGVDARPW